MSCVNGAIALVEGSWWAACAPIPVTIGNWGILRNFPRFAQDLPKICPRSDRFQGINYHRDHHNLTDSEDGAQVNSSITHPGDRLQGNLPIAESGYSSRGDRDQPQSIPKNSRVSELLQGKPRGGAIGIPRQRLDRWRVRCPFRLH